MSARHNLRLHSPLKTILGKLGESYQAYCNTFKIHTMATCHRGSGQPLDKVTNTPRKEQPVVDTDIELQQDPHSKDVEQFEDLGHNNPDRLHVMTRELDNLHHCIHAEEREPSESLHHIEWELH